MCIVVRYLGELNIVRNDHGTLGVPFRIGVGQTDSNASNSIIDIDNDGYPELAQVARNSQNMSVNWFPKEDFSSLDDRNSLSKKDSYTIETVQTTGIVTLDMNNDSFDDLLIYPFDVNTDVATIAKNNGDGTFNFETMRIELSHQTYISSVLFVDVTRDGLKDIVFNHSGVAVLDEHGNIVAWTYLRIPSLRYSQTIIIDDMDNDGYNDFVFRKVDDERGIDEIRIYSGSEGDWEQTYALPLKNFVQDHLWGFVVSDLDNDGMKEVSGSYAKQQGDKAWTSTVFLSEFNGNEFGEWELAETTLSPSIYLNLPRQLMQNGNARAFVGAVGLTNSSAKSAFVAENFIVQYMAQNNEIGKAVHLSMQEYYTRCIENPRHCGFLKPEDYLWDYFVFHIYGDPTAVIRGL